MFIYLYYIIYLYLHLKNTLKKSSTFAYLLIGKPGMDLMQQKCEKNT